MLYKDYSKNITDRVEDLLVRMTLKEKIAQLYGMVNLGQQDPIQNVKDNFRHGVGTVSFLNSSQTGNTEKDMDILNKIQRFFVEETRLGIPALVHNEGIAGAQIPGATTFPQSMNLAATWEPDLARKMGEAVRKQLLAFGTRAVHSPLFDLGRDPRWGRIGETYGEDPYLVAQMGTSYVKGVQGNHEVMAAAKHFVGYGNAEGGRNGGEQQIAERKLLDTYCFPFEAAIHQGQVMGIMNSYGILNEQPVSTSKWLLTDILREKLGFQGLVVADYGSVSHANARYRVAKTQKETGIMALKAGMDVEQPNNTSYRYLEEAVESGELEMEYIDRSVRRVLETKFKLGLFENPYTSGGFIEEVRKVEYLELSQEIAEKSIVMVKNDEKILPLNRKLKVAVIGPSANNKINFFGGYSSVGTAETSTRDFDRSEDDNFIKMAYDAVITEHRDMLKSRGIVFDQQPSPEQKTMIIEMLKKNRRTSNKEYKSSEEFVEKYYPTCSTVKEVLEGEFGKENILYAKGCEISQPIEDGIEQVKKAVHQADIVIAVLGGKESMRAPDATSGENKDNLNINLEKSQLEMMESVFKLGKPVISVIVDGRPLATPIISEKSKAVLYAWLPAQTGAQAIVNILSGKRNPSGKLPVTVLKDSGQIPMYHSRLPFFVGLDEWAEYIDHDKNTPLYPFGYGLSFTKFEYSNLRLQKEVVSDGELQVTFTIKNIGNYEGDEVVQLYIRDCFSSIARPTKQLIGFVRVSLDMEEEKEVTFTVDMKQLAFHNHNMKQVVEPGEMELYVGASSEDIRLNDTFHIIGEERIVERKVFSSKVIVN
ncbi:glycoside hydrolase family 3 C-terminal domain-containing protein [Neobacillus drentensis]|uniref:glycoside hydrolase family 3 N-terminal domain-containing protein n=1 Tax=Neobacillus drentensis TaxID=220684 RepID=UPI001F483A13|nr:glycoside hydrolase family 3 N-terminal domain-containing protein [Neobacillus drentensis]ULT54854.1 glycoside hydrolase family 3 C-terminal domain-containing protein [Neobacillus drentensis]